MLVQLEGTVLPGRVEEFKALLTARFPETRAFDGCNDITAYLADEGRDFVFVENWDSRSQYEAYLAWREETGVLGQLGALMEGPPQIRFFDAIDA
jgi:quinol monooxygenase YgiN